MTAPAFPKPSRPAIADRNLAAWGLLCACGVFAALAWPFWRGELYLADDLGAFHLPLRAFYSDCLRGWAFDWMPSLFAGFYVTGEGQAGFYHPLHGALYRWLPLTTAFGLEVLASFPVLLVGALVWLLLAAAAALAAALGALVATFSGFNLLHLAHVNALVISAHLPWLLIALEVACGGRAVRGPRCEKIGVRPRRAAWAEAAIALLTGSQLLLGYPQYVWFSLLVETWWVAYLASRGATIPWTRLAVAKAFGLALGLAQILPMLEALGDSTRQTADDALAIYGSLHPLNLVQSIAPYLFTTRVVGQNTHELGCYLGAAPLLLLVAWLARGDFRHRRAMGAALALLGLAFWLALGEFGGLYRLQTWLPVVGKFRFPSRYVAVAAWAMSLVAAISFAQLTRRAGRPRAGQHDSRRVLGALVAMSLILALLAPWLFPPQYLAPLAWRLAGPAILAITALALVALERGWMWARPLFVAWATLDLAFYGLSYSLPDRTARFDHWLAQVPGAPGAADDTLAVQLRQGGEPAAMWTNQLSLAGRRTIDAYCGLLPARRLDYRSLPALQLAGVRYVGRNPGTIAIPGLLPFDNAWLEVPRPQARVRFVTDVCVDPNTDLPDRLDLERVALVDRPLPGLDRPGADSPLGDARQVVDEPGRLVFAVACETTQLLVIADSYHRGWRAEVDGRPRDVLRVNGDFLGLVVEPGEREVALTFAPHSAIYGRWGSLGALAVLLVGTGLRLPKQIQFRSVAKARWTGESP